MSEVQGLPVGIAEKVKELIAFFIFNDYNMLLDLED
jgi:hypothetical protein